MSHAALASMRVYLDRAQFRPHLLVLLVTLPSRSGGLCYERLELSEIFTSRKKSDKLSQIKVYEIIFLSQTIWPKKIRCTPVRKGGKYRIEERRLKIEERKEDAMRVMGQTAVLIIGEIGR
jgi:hypothetical protein